MMQEWPSISILVAARNEAHQIIDCLQCLSQLEYQGKWEVWIGNDASTDRTEEVVQGFIEGLPHFHLLTIEKSVGHARGKANVLAQLTAAATGELYLFTDADVLVPTTWATSLVRAWNPSIGVVTGFTLVEGRSVFAMLQGLDWTLALSLIKLSTDFGIPTTAMGNNMLISAEAYRATGGYERIPFSVTEDYALFKASVNRGYGFKQLISKEVMASTQAMDSWGNLLQQRQRWMHGAMQVPWYLRIGLLLQVGWVPFMLTLFFLNPIWAGVMWIAKTLVQSLLLLFQLARLGKPKALLALPLYEPYALYTYTAMTVKYYLSKEVEWKGRTF